MRIDYPDDPEYWRARNHIDQTRVILHAHWIAFNYLGVLTIDFDEWDDIAMKLDRLHDEFPGLIDHGYEAEHFLDFNIDNLIDLPVTDYIVNVATAMIRRQGHDLQAVLEPLDIHGEVESDFAPRLMGAA